MAQNLKFRDVWYFVGQKGIKGFTNMEKVFMLGFYILPWNFYTCFRFDFLHTAILQQTTFRKILNVHSAERNEHFLSWKALKTLWQKKK